MKSQKRWSWFYAKFLTWKAGGRCVVSPFLGDGFDGECCWQLPMRFADTGEPYTDAEPRHG